MALSTTYQEIMTQTDAWQDALQTIITRQRDIQAFWQNGRYEQVIFTGCGSTYYLAQTAASLFQTKMAVASRPTPASELLLHLDSIYVPNKRTLLVTISRSGVTTETVQAAQNFIEQGYGDVLAISCYSDKALNQAATMTLAAHGGQEVSIAQTRSFSAMLVLIEVMTKVLAGGSVDEEIFAGSDQRYVEDALRIADPLTDPQRFQRYFYLGSGVRYGLAAEAMLKMKEMSLTSAEVFHPLEFRHGPKSMVDGETVVVGLLGDKGYAAEQAVLTEMGALGATTFSIGANPDADYVLPEGKNALVHIMPILQWLAHQRAVNKKLDPDRPRHLEQVVHLESVKL
jgi:glucosamine--fructose-6-phosphate aminotransferase (isomerizing)